MEVYLIRHTRVGVAPGICYGQSDVPLAESFATDINVVVEKLKTQLGAEPMVFSSPAQRCTQLATQINPQVELVSALQELNFGAWEMRAWAELPAEETSLWMENFVEKRPPKGESFQELQTRASAFFTTLPQLEQSPIVIIAHAGSIRSMICQAIGLPLSKAFQIELDYGSITKLVYRWGLWNLKFLNL